jgi:hypothetical protein
MRMAIESMLTTQEYYVTTPFVSQYISPDVVNVDLYLETESGDLYWSSFEATDYTSMKKTAAGGRGCASITSR